MAALVSTKNQEEVQTSSLLTDPRFERLLTIGKEMNDMRVKIRAATEFIMNRKDQGNVEDVEIAREELLRDLQRDSDEANEQISVIDEMIGKFSDEITTIESRRKLNKGLARIEGITGGDERSKEFLNAADIEGKKISELENLISALDALERDLTSRRREPIACPRCSSRNISYRITPSELGFSLYKCGKCANAWKVTHFSFAVG